MSPMFIKRNSVFAWLNESAAIAGKEKLTIKHKTFIFFHIVSFFPLPQSFQNQTSPVS